MEQGVDRSATTTAHSFGVGNGFSSATFQPDYVRKVMEWFRRNDEANMRDRGKDLTGVEMGKMKSALSQV
ncbi:unnamed protein product [Heligmosomoides polygyrus]|uniref:SCP domain-containing protein n=1 Tax=Heligmosomoides polygyrus TaxID=6339 RepID=A0A183FWT4_HELPZ|nr:unnamed protein product [Heligmosomoides polygyrus]